MKEEKIVRYQSYEEDMVFSHNQNYKLPENYVWIREGILWKILYGGMYAAALLFSYFYCGIYLGVRVKNRSVLKKSRKNGFYLYGNHTQMVGDAFIPAFVCRNKRIYVVVSPANLGIPVLGKVLPYMGALPVPEDRKQFLIFTNAVSKRAKEGNAVVIYPEAHVWQYYTKIRPYSTASFHYPVSDNLPVYVMTTTYQKRKIGKRPRITVYVDGPFVPGENLKKREKIDDLYKQVQNSMEQNSKNSTYEYMKYEEVK